ncbi:MAG: signal recognition particle protein [Kiritimatiellae bacterium]|nr:signal recognition particle protein [Kiritimatiellia bacterium]
MFDTLTESFQRIFKKLRGYGKLTEQNMDQALRDVRLALLEADVNYQVARDFIARVREKCRGQDVLDSVTPGQQVVKRVHEELAALLGSTRAELDLSERPALLLLLGLHGAGKTTTAAKLALLHGKAGRKVLLAGCDIRRPAAVEQLRLLAEQVGARMLAPEPGETVPEIGRRARETAARENLDLVIFDTGGRFQLDRELVQEVRDLREAVAPRNVALVLDTAMGQESVHVAEAFHKEIGLTGLILTKLDGDARGGAALSVRAVTGCPILLAGAGERMADLEPFHPDRMASRILGMGDVVSLVEKAQEVVDEQEAARLEERLRKNTLNLEDFLDQMRQMSKLGPLENLIEMLPGAGRLPGAARRQIAETSDRDWKRAEAIILSMTPRERRHPELIDASRKRRIARGSGTDVRDVNDLLKRFDQARKMARQFKKMEKRLPRPPH